MSEPKISARYFVFDGDGSIRPIGQRLLSRLMYTNHCLPEYAGKQVKSVCVTYEYIDRRPVNIIRLYWELWSFDERGEMIVDREGAALALEAGWSKAQPKQGNVVNIGPQLQLAKHRRETTWQPQPEHLNKVYEVVLKTRKRSKVVQHPSSRDIIAAKKRRLRMTVEKALDKAGSHFWELRFEIDGLNKEELTLFQTNARERAKKSDGFDKGQWTYLADYVGEKLKAYDRWEDGGGTWYAVAVLTHWNGPQRDRGEDEEIEEVKCDGRDAAVKMMQEMHARYAHLAKPLSHLHVSVHPEGWEQE